MSAAVVFERASASAELADAELDALVAGTPTDGLRAAGLVGADGVDPALAPAVAAVTDPLAAVAFERDGAQARIWVAPRASAIVMPAGPGRRRLVGVPTRFVPDAVARLAELGPRPRHDPPVRLRFAPGALATLLAGRTFAAPLAGGPAENAAAERLAAGLRGHWRAEARWRPSAASPGVRAVEVVDTEDGLWHVVPDGPEVELWPSTPTHVFRQLAALLPRDAELDRG
jgi:hypothetical protein